MVESASKLTFPFAVFTQFNKWDAFKAGKAAVSRAYIKMSFHLEELHFFRIADSIKCSSTGGQNYTVSLWSQTVACHQFPLQR